MELVHLLVPGICFLPAHTEELFTILDLKRGRHFWRISISISSVSLPTKFYHHHLPMPITPACMGGSPPERAHHFWFFVWRPTPSFGAWENANFCLQAAVGSKSWRCVCDPSWVSFSNFAGLIIPPQIIPHLDSSLDSAHFQRTGSL